MENTEVSHDRLEEVSRQVDYEFELYWNWGCEDEKRAGRVNFWRAYEGDKWNKTHRELGYESPRHSDFDLNQTPGPKIGSDKECNSK